MIFSHAYIRGFVEEGRLRKAMWSDGDWQDVIMMAMLDEEWREREVQR